MSDIPEDLKYTKDHEWIKTEEDGLFTVGITDHAQEALGDLVFIELPEVESNLPSGQTCSVVESVKAASDVYIPLSGKIVEVNNLLSDSPELVNQDPYGDGWLFRLKASSSVELDDMLDSDSYAELLDEG
ncbi:MAG: glycine cleavage system protein H [Gammaproteobacteria bacterium TMED78]|nr:MAG: glycine cleavage system protein H [Gammaproteobacteria bacterium TMED78]|tara:strand:+ start:479 stop:868 length:390 start_codon:yes stop_codon:yes gene_type:complete